MATGCKDNMSTKGIKKFIMTYSARGLDSLLGRPLEGRGGEPSGGDPSVPGDHLAHVGLRFETRPKAQWRSKILASALTSSKVSRKQVMPDVINSCDLS